MGCKSHAKAQSRQELLLFSAPLRLCVSRHRQRLERIRRLPLFPAVRAGIGALFMLILAVGGGGAAIKANSTNQAALVVVHGDGRVQTRCVDFAEPQLSGLELLQRAGLEMSLETTGMGSSICSLDGEGCTYPQQGCFCQCEGATCLYWSYWRWENDAWRYSSLGASSSTVAPGALEGWVWGAGAVENAQPPPMIDYAAVCAPATPTATVTPSPTTQATATATAPPTVAATAMPSSATATVATTAPTWTATPLAQTSTPTAIPPATPTALPTSPQLTLPAAPVAPLAGLPAPVIEYFLADRKEIAAGETVTLGWRVTNAVTVQLQAAGQVLDVGPEGSIRLTPIQNTTYLIVAGNAGGNAAVGFTIIVRPVVAPMATAAPIPTFTLPAPTAPVVTVAASGATTAANPLHSAPTLSPVQPVPLTATPTKTATALATTTLAAISLRTSTPLASMMAATATPGLQGVMNPLLVVVVGLLALAGLSLAGIVALLGFLWLSRL